MNAARFLPRFEFAPGTYLPYGLLVLWVLSMVLLPIARWNFGDAALPWGVTITTLLQAGAVIAVLRSAWSGTRTLLTVGVVVVLAWSVEFIGSHTGIPFGEYRYTDVLQPQLANVPVILPFAWLMMLPAAWAVAATLAGTWRGPRFILLSAVAFTAWDLFLDPQMVGWNLWQWAEPGGYFGIPWVNYLGWLLASAGITIAARPAALPVYPLLLIYGTVWILQAIGQFFFWDQPGPALVGGVVMGAIFLLAMSRVREQDT